MKEITSYDLRSDDALHQFLHEAYVKNQGVVIPADMLKDFVEVVCRIMNGGQIKSRRGVCIPGIKLNVPYISEQDREDIKYACLNDGDYLAISFVNCKEDVLAVKELCSGCIRYYYGSAWRFGY